MIIRLRHALHLLCVLTIRRTTGNQNRGWWSTVDCKASISFSKERCPVCSPSMQHVWCSPSSYCAVRVVCKDTARRHTGQSTTLFSASIRTKHGRHATRCPHVSNSSVRGRSIQIVHSGALTKTAIGGDCSTPSSNTNVSSAGAMRTRRSLGRERWVVPAMAVPYFDHQSSTTTKRRPSWCVTT